MKKNGSSIVVICSILIFLSTVAFGQGEPPFPTKPINMYVGYPPGGMTAITGQVTATGMQKYLKQPVVLNTKPGAVQLVAAEFVKNSKPDGYTILYASHTNLTAKLAMDKKDGVAVKFRMEDLDPLGAGPTSPYVMTVNKESPWKTVEDLIAAARKSPGSINFGPDGIGTCGHLLMELVSQKMGITLSTIPFQGAGPAITSLLGGHVQIVTNSVTTFGAHIKPGGGLRALMVFDTKRDPSLPDVPTSYEKGFNVSLTSWQGLRAPKGLPKPVRDSLVQAFEKTMKDPEILQAMVKLGGGITYWNPEETEKHTQDEYRLFSDIWAKIGKK